MSDDLDVKKSNYDVAESGVDLGVQNASYPSKFYSVSPCLVGYTYMRLMVDGNILPCCVAKHEVGDVHNSDWRDVWHSGGYENFRKKMARIHVDKFHLYDPEWSFCQQCSHLPMNQRSTDLLKK